MLGHTSAAGRYRSPSLAAGQAPGLIPGEGIASQLYLVCEHVLDVLECSSLSSLNSVECIASSDSLAAGILLFQDRWIR